METDSISVSIGSSDSLGDPACDPSQKYSSCLAVTSSWFSFTVSFSGKGMRRDPSPILVFLSLLLLIRLFLLFWFCEERRHWSQSGLFLWISVLVRDICLLFSSFILTSRSSLSRFWLLFQDLQVEDHPLLTLVSISHSCTSETTCILTNLYSCPEEKRETTRRTKIEVKSLDSFSSYTFTLYKLVSLGFSKFVFAFSLLRKVKFSIIISTPTRKYPGSVSYWCYDYSLCVSW